MYAVHLVWPDIFTASIIAGFKALLLSVFQLSCSAILLIANDIGSVKAIQNVMEWMSPLRETTYCSVQYVGCAEESCLGEHFAQLPCFEAVGVHACQYVISTADGDGFLGLFARRACLKETEFGMQINFTTQGLVTLPCKPARSLLAAPSTCGLDLLHCCNGVVESAGT